jgi:hypothetical protein
MGRMSPLHNPAAGLTGVVALLPVSRNGDTPNTANGESVDLRNKRGAMFVVAAGALTGAANYLAYLQTGDNPNDAANANWTNVNATLYTNAAVTVKTNANSAWEMDFDAATGGASHVRMVLVTSANVAVIGATAITY